MAFSGNGMTALLLEAGQRICGLIKSRFSDAHNAVKSTTNFPSNNAQNYCHYVRKHRPNSTDPQCQSFFIMHTGFFQSFLPWGNCDLDVVIIVTVYV